MIANAAKFISTFMLLVCIIVIFVLHPSLGLGFNNYHFDLQTFTTSLLDANLLTFPSDYTQGALLFESFRDTTIGQKVTMLIQLPTMVLETALFGLRFCLYLTNPFTSVWEEYDNPLYDSP